MKKFWIGFLIVFFSLNLVLFSAEPSVSVYLQDISVTIKSGNSSGSGVIFTRKDKNNDYICFVWTAAHVVDNLRQETEFISTEGTKKIKVEFQDVQIVKVLIEEGRTVGKVEFDAQVVKYSDADKGEDLCLLKLRKKNFIKSGVKFYTESKILELGTPVYHVGSLLGIGGANSLTMGIISQNGRIINKRIFDQYTSSSFPGSSGGGIFLLNGQYIAMLTRGAGESFSLGIPYRRIKIWAEKNNVIWALDENVPLPNEEEIDELPVEDKVIKEKAK